MPFTAQELESAANALIEYNFNTPNIRSQTIQDKPLLAAMMDKEKPFPGGKDTITFAVKGTYTTTIQGFDSNDVVGYGNPANIKRGNVPWKLIHAGLEVTMHELLKAGISIDDAAGDGDMDRAKRHSQSEKVVLVDMLKDKIEDLMEGTDRGMNTMFWLDGTQDSKQVPGLQSFVLDDPTTATIVEGIDQSTNTWWRNIAALALNSSTPSNQVVVQQLQRSWRQIRRYGGVPNLVLCGSSFIDFMEQELRSKGNYTLEGWTSNKTTDASIADIKFKGVNFQYDPTLDDQGRSKYCYVLDTKHIYPMVIEGESMKKHSPERPAQQYLFYRALTWVGGLVCDQRNAQAVFSIA
jgi:hypothetical protein